MARDSAVLGGDADPAVPGPVPIHLLLLSRRVLQSLLGRSDFLHGGRARNSYRGEKKFPLILQNIHRYFLYFAIIFVFILLYDGYKALWFTGADGAKHFGIGIGSLVLILNPILLGGYTFGCHSLRHLVGGMKDILSRAPARKKAYDCVSCLNRGHMKWAWVSMFFVGFADLYVRLCSMGIWHDWRIL